MVSIPDRLHHTMSLRGTQHRIRYHAGVTPQQLFDNLRTRLYTAIGSSNMDRQFVRTLITRTIKLERPEEETWLSGTLIPKESFMLFTTYIEILNERDNQTIRNFLDLLINLMEFPFMLESIKLTILEHFEHCIEFQTTMGTMTEIFSDQDAKPKFLDRMKAEFHKLIQYFVKMTPKSRKYLKSRKKKQVPDQVAPLYQASTSSSLTLRSRDPETRAIRLGTADIYYYDKKIICKGETSIVYEGFHMSINRPAAVKWLYSKGSTLSENELKVWKSIKNLTRENINIVQLYAYKPWDEGVGLPKTYYFAMELATVDLKKRVEGFSSNPEIDHYEKLKSYLHDAANGLQWLHSRKPVIIHRDIKPHNILIFKIEGGKRETAKLGDFGICKSPSRASTMGTNTKGIGTLNWMSPEAIAAYWNDETFRMTPSVDIFSFGMTCSYAMSLGKHPFEIYGSSNIFYDNIRNPSQVPNRCSFLSDPLVEGNHLFSWMMQKTEYESKRRPTIHQVLSHPFFYGPFRSLKLILDVAKCLDDKKNPEILNIRMKLDKNFEEFMKRQRPASNMPLNSICFDWKQNLGDLIFKLLSQRKSSNAIKKYNGESVMSLIELIRDKNVHYTNLQDGLIKNEQVFGMQMENGNWRFSEKKYITFFQNKFPELVTFLFMFFTKESSQIVDTLKHENNLNGFVSMPIDF